MGLGNAEGAVIDSADCARLWLEGVDGGGVFEPSRGGGSACARAGVPGVVLATCRETGRSMRVRRKGHTRGENSGVDPNSCARRNGRRANERHDGKGKK